MLVQPFDRQALRRQFAQASPFPFIKIDNFLDPTFVLDVSAAYPSFETARGLGMSFKTVNERKKVQITDAKLFPKAVARLNEALASPSFLSDLSYITGIPDLLADQELVGGGIHVTGPGGRLDVHVDFNYLETRKLHRRLNFLLYLNPIWEEQWGGHIQLWDKSVKECRQAFVPILNRCIIFETSEISFHGVTPVADDAPSPRLSFASYYYTRQPPPIWKGNVHGTIFKARPQERLRGYVLMPAALIQQQLATSVHRIKQGVKRLVNVVR